MKERFTALINGFQPEFARKRNFRAGFFYNIKYGHLEVMA